jgi:hypothetical protein
MYGFRRGYNQSVKDFYYRRAPKITRHVFGGKKLTKVSWGVLLENAGFPKDRIQPDCELPLTLSQWTKNVSGGTLDYISEMGGWGWGCLSHCTLTTHHPPSPLTTPHTLTLPHPQAPSITLTHSLSPSPTHPPSPSLISTLTLTHPYPHPEREQMKTAASTQRVQDKYRYKMHLWYFFLFPLSKIVFYLAQKSVGHMNI